MLIYIVLGSIPAMVLKFIGLRRIANKWAGSIASICAKFIFFILNIHVHVSGDFEAVKALKKNKEKICFISNHTSVLDILMALGPLSLNCGFVTKIQAAYIPLINIISLSLNSVFLDRNNLRKSAKSIKRGVKKIENGASLLIFPEGTRSKTGEIAPYKHGAFKLAILSESTIVPLTIKGVRQACEDRNYFFKHIDCYLNVGTPCPTKGLNREEIFDLENQIEYKTREIYNSLGEK